MTDPTKTQILIMSDAHVRVYLDGELMTHVKGFNTREGTVEQVQFDFDEVRRCKKYVVTTLRGKVDAEFIPDA